MPAANAPKISHILEFAEGTFLIAGGAPYFVAPGDEAAYLAYGSREELLGKHCHKLETRAAGFKTYALTYEFEGDELIAARLISPLGRSKGWEASPSLRARFAAAVESGALPLHGRQEPPRIVRAARTAGGRTLLMLENMPGEDFRSLMIGPEAGKPGAFEKLPVKTYMQGGAHFIFQLADGGSVDLPSGLMGPGPGDFPSYNGEPMAYLDPGKLSFAALGIAAAPTRLHLDPFCPELQAPPRP
jgi:hypothetical protein